MILGKHSYGNPIIHWENKNAILNIGNFCSIAGNVNIWLGGNHHIDWVTTYPFGDIKQHIFNKFKGEGHPTTKGNVNIGNDVWIAENVTIMSGVSIGDGAVIAQNSHIVKNVPPYALVGGNPGQIIKYRFTEKQIADLLEIKWWNWDDNIINEYTNLLCSNDIQKFIDSVKKHTVINLDKDYLENLLKDYDKNLEEYFDKIHDKETYYGFGQEHYRLFAGISCQCDNKKILELGTHNGKSAISLSYGKIIGKNITINTFDIINLLTDKCKLFFNNYSINYKLENLFDNDNREKNKNFILSHDIIFIDIDPHNGILEYEMYLWLKNNSYKGIIIYDDIKLGLNHSANGYEKTTHKMSDFWDKIDANEKIDITHLGHWSGTGVIIFDKEKNKLI